MKTVMIKGEVLADGHLRLDVPCGLPPGPVEVCLVIHPNSETLSKRAARFSTFGGCMADQFPDDLDIEPIFNEMAQHWQESLLPK
jgi:hypothetical protein